MIFQQPLFILYRINKCKHKSEEAIKAKFAEMHQEGELADDELDNVAGGCSYDHYDDGRFMRIRVKGTDLELYVSSEGDDLDGHYVYAMYDDGKIYGKIHEWNYEVIATGASGSF